MSLGRAVRQTGRIGRRVVDEKCRGAGRRAYGAGCCAGTEQQFPLPAPGRGGGRVQYCRRSPPKYRRSGRQSRGLRRAMRENAFAYGCAQQVLARTRMRACARLDRVDISRSGASGGGNSRHKHLAARKRGAFARRNTNAWWPHIENAGRRFASRSDARQRRD
jgi:hypothetical protein